MKATTIISALALTGSTVAGSTHPALQQKIQTLEVQIVNVINDIVQSNTAALQTSYNAGTDQFSDLTLKLAGRRGCSPFFPGDSKGKGKAIEFLQDSQEALMQLSLDLLDPENSVDEGDFHSDVCIAYGYYGAIANFVGSQ